MLYQLRRACCWALAKACALLSVFLVDHVTITKSELYDDHPLLRIRRRSSSERRRSWPLPERDEFPRRAAPNLTCFHHHAPPTWPVFIARLRPPPPRSRLSTPRTDSFRPMTEIGRHFRIADRISGFLRWPTPTVWFAASTEVVHWSTDEQQAGQPVEEQASNHGPGRCPFPEHFWWS